MVPGEESGESVGATQRLPTFLTRHHLAGGGMYAKKRGRIYLLFGKRVIEARLAK